MDNLKFVVKWVIQLVFGLLIAVMSLFAVVTLSLLAFFQPHDFLNIAVPILIGGVVVGIYAWADNNL